MLAVNFESTITLGAIILAALLSVTGLLVLLYGGRWKAAALVEAANAAAWEDTASRLQLRVDDLELRLKRAEVRIAEFEALPDLGEVIAAITEHERTANVRSEAVVTLLTEIRDYLRQGR